MIASAQLFLITLIAYGAFAFQLYALVDALRHTNEAFFSAGKRNKSFWTAILGGAALIGFLGIPGPVGLGITTPFSLFGIAAIAAAGIYMTNVRPKLGPLGGGRKPRNDNRGGW